MKLITTLLLVSAFYVFHDIKFKSFRKLFNLEKRKLYSTLHFISLTILFNISSLRIHDIHFTD